MAGLTRATVIGLAKAQGLRILEADLEGARIDCAEEVFLTGTAAEIVPVVEAFGRAWQPGPATAALSARYQALARAET